eukprot:833170-Amorphochlora_amoeboformis.AAC.1
MYPQTPNLKQPSKLPKRATCPGTTLNLNPSSNPNQPNPNQIPTPTKLTTPFRPEDIANTLDFDPGSENVNSRSDSDPLGLPQVIGFLIPLASPFPSFIHAARAMYGCDLADGRKRDYRESQRNRWDGGEGGVSSVECGGKSGAAGGVSET